MKIQHYIDRIRKEMPTFDYNTYEIFDDGRDHVGIAFDKTCIFRFLKGEKEDSLELEHLLLIFLQDKVSCRLPESLFLSEERRFNQETFMT